MTKRTSQALRGFSLVELSIVLVIVGLLVGGILAGQNLVRSSELRSVTTDISKFTTAINAFQDRYDSLPGDLATATTYWGAANADATTCKTTIGTGTQTCNGDGNGKTAEYTVTDYESFRAWQQLKNAGLIEGSYTGVRVNATNGVDLGVNSPESRIGGAGYSLFYMTNVGADLSWFNDTYRHIIQFGAEVGNPATTANFNPVITPPEALSIDAKSDDGRPGTGTIMTKKSSSAYVGNCASSASADTAVYSVSSNAPICDLVFKLGF
jgi:prepilin-type N-terminal cleavage/methylation domain-containing protein